MVRRGVYPGSFNPPTTAHLAVSDAARRLHELDEVVWTVSVQALAKLDVDHPRLDHRLDVLRRVADGIDWLRVDVTESQLLADIAEGYEVLVMGADKWHQINELQWYADAADRDRQLARLPTVAVAPRAGHDVPAELLLHVDDDHHHVSSTAARRGAHHLMLPPAREFAERTGAWIDPVRYERDHT